MEILLITTLIVGFGALFLTKDKSNAKPQRDSGISIAPRLSVAVRNNNPGNLVPNPNFEWKGQVGVSSGKVKFDTVENGIRASYINLRTYFVNGFNTVDKIINRWAPSFENPTSSYILFVSDRTGYLSTTELEFNDETAFNILSAIFRFESGKEYDKQTILLGFSLA